MVPLLPVLAIVLSQVTLGTSQTSPSPQNASQIICPPDIGPTLEAIHESQTAPTGFAVDSKLNFYLAYPRNAGIVATNVAIARNFTAEEPWPNTAIQNCALGQDASTCFINVQNLVLDPLDTGVMWVVDSGIPFGMSAPLVGGAKIMSFDISTRAVLKTYPIPKSLLYGNLNLNDVRINATSGFAFMTEIGSGSSLLALNLKNGNVNRRLFNTTVVRWDDKYVGSYDGQLIYSWFGTQKSYQQVGADGIALASNRLYWGVLASRRFYYIDQDVLTNTALSDQEVLDAVQDPGQVGSEQAGFTADDKGRVYILASEQHAIYYVESQQQHVAERINGVAAGGHGLVPAKNHIVKTLVKSPLIQHADSAAIWDGWLYFCTNQLELGPPRQYMNVDRRKGPFRSYRVYIGAGPAV